MNKKKLFIIFIILVFTLSIETASIAVIKGTVNTETVRVREEATTDSDIVKLVSIGEKITVTGDSGNWYKVQIAGITGYIRKDLLDLEQELPSSTENSKPSDTNNDNENEDTNVDEGNAENENVDTNNSEDNNENISLENPSAVMSEEKTISTITLNQDELVIGAKKKLESEVKLKILPLANSNNVLAVSDAEVTIVEIMNSWCKVETTEGENGWIRIDQ